MIRINPAIRNITVSGRIASGATTLAKSVARELNWTLFEGGKLFDEFFDKEKGSDADRPDKFDIKFEERIKKRLKDNSHQIIQSHLAGFSAQKIDGIFKIGVICENEAGEDMTQERAKRLGERKGENTKTAEKEIIKREEGNLKKWRRLYANGDPNWVYWDQKYYDVIINTYVLNQEEALKKALTALQVKK